MEKHVALIIHGDSHRDEAKDTKRQLETFLDLGNLERENLVGIVIDAAVAGRP
jgi:calcineurin-like phosphoesterase family protein